MVSSALNLSGLHQSPGKGAGIEFSQYRSYQPGDDLRRIDWKLYARSDRFFIRDSETETHTNVRILLDGSASMNHTEKNLRKFDYARMLAAAIAYVAIAQGDGTGLYILQQQGIEAIPPQRSYSQFGRIIHALEKANPQGLFPSLEQHRAVLEGWFNSSAHELLVLITDLHEHTGEIKKIIDFLQSPRREIIVFQLLGESERFFDYQGSLMLEDLETGEQIRVDADRAREHYLKQLQEQLSVHQGEFSDYHLFMMNEPIEVAIGEYLRKRK